jgi:hypothetical protein
MILGRLKPSYLISWCVLLVSSTADDVLLYVHYYFISGNNADAN